MGDQLTLLLLGPPYLAIGETPVAVRSAKSRALLCHLAAAPGPRSRAELAGLLWGERPDAHARGSLRLALSELRKEVGGWLDITRDHVGFRADQCCHVDHAKLTGVTTIGEALKLWRGEFMDGVAFVDAPAFAEWLAAERLRVRALFRDLLVRQAGPAHEIVKLARLLSELDPYDEEVHRLLISSLAETGNRAPALLAYANLRDRLATDLGVEPAAETRAIRQALGPQRKPAALPVPSTPLVGRKAEVDQVAALLGRERIVTLLGPGGVGKTRLALAAAARVPGAAFVTFAGVGPEAAVTTVARRLGMDLSSPRPAKELLFETLADRCLLLVLDNLEHLPDFDAVIAELIAACPGVRVLATSRRRLTLPSFAVVVDGLSPPAAEELFAVRARTVRPAFDPGRESALVADICAATRGLPLAIELAASLLRALSCADLADHLNTGLLGADALTPRPRHATMRRVFETSWTLLTDEARRVLPILSAFGGGFTLEAALDVAETTPEVLVHLVDHSMITFQPPARYLIHPLIQAFATQHLTTEQPTRLRHAHHFKALLKKHAHGLHDATDEQTPTLLAAELDNIRLAWTHAPNPGFLDLYWTLCLRLGLYEESAAIVETNLEADRPTPEQRARRLRMAAVSYYQLAKERRALHLAEEALEALGRPLPSGWRRTVVHLCSPASPTPREAEAAQALSLIAMFAYYRQDLPTMLSATLLQLNAVNRSAAPELRAEAYANVATAVRTAGQSRLARRYARRADEALASLPRTHVSEAANRARVARGIDQLSCGALEAAWRSFTEARSRTLEPRLAEVCTGLLAETSMWRGEFARAAELFVVTGELSARRVGGDDIGRYWCLTGQAEALLRQEGVPSARIREVLTAAQAATNRRRALEQAFGLRNGPIVEVIQRMRLFTGFARTDLLDGRPERAAEAVPEIVALAGKLPSAQPGMLECWSGLAELLWELRRPDPAVVRTVLRGIRGYAARYPGAAARLGWGQVLLRGTAGMPVRKTAWKAMQEADRLGVAYDIRRAAEAADVSAST
ncbi:AfsR/SARP family transcriptional regulator [Herbidospora daliensis]|uniref:AfsR/SARP family transcriptional regulator n=1 Tax=Herbidospora daliensis TaxID=295585 RepID=UPI000784D435|nr:BTAD domain-containing putative transcriptional regulator [Herbidospora daliensis]